MAGGLSGGRRGSLLYDDERSLRDKGDYICVAARQEPVSEALQQESGSRQSCSLRVSLRLPPGGASLPYHRPVVQLVGRGERLLDPRRDTFDQLRIRLTCFFLVSRFDRNACSRCLLRIGLERRNLGAGCGGRSAFAIKSLSFCLHRCARLNEVRVWSGWDVLAFLGRSDTAGRDLGG